MGINVLSLFDGMSCGQIALDQLGIEVDNYFASEIDKPAIKVTQHNYPKTIQLGDVTKVTADALPKIDLFIGGSPCTGFSTAGTQLNFEHYESKLFFEYVRLLKETKPTYFLLENVGMKKEWEKIITKHMGVVPITINSSLVSAQLRHRLYWTNIPVKYFPKDRKIKLQDILEDGYVDREKSLCLCSSYAGKGSVRLNRYIDNYFSHQVVFLDKESKYTYKSRFRKLTPLECERLQTVPEGYTSVASEDQRHRMLGNGWTVDVIKHMFWFLPYPKTAPAPEKSTEILF